MIRINCWIVNLSNREGDVNHDNYYYSNIVMVSIKEEDNRRNLGEMIRENQGKVDRLERNRINLRVYWID